MELRSPDDTWIHKLARRIAKGLETLYLKELFIIAIVIGVISGVASIIFYELLNFIMYILLKVIVGFQVPEPGSEWGLSNPPLRPWIIPIVTMLGGLLSGVLVYSFAPEAEGHGTDAAIAVFHKHAGRSRARVPLIKMIASSITIGSGGSAGREGPMAQIGSGVGSILASLMKLDTYKRRIATAIGIGAGIGTIFKAPLGGAIFGMEVLYKRDFEVEALLPAFIASTIGYTIFGLYDGFDHVFSIPEVAFNHPIEIPFYALLGVVTALIGILYVKTFYGVKELFDNIKIPNHFKPMIGCLFTGLIGILFPHVLEMGYGWITLFAHNQFPIAYLGDKWVFGESWEIIVVALLIMALLKILATALTIGSGGSGGVFAPGLCIGAMVGAALGLLYINLFPGVIPDEDVFLTSAIVIGMMSLFAGVSKAPIAVLIMISEMTGSYELIAPAMLSIAISYLLTWNHSIYSEQVLDRAHSPAHLGEYHKVVLTELKVKEAMRRRYPTISVNSTAREALAIIVKEKVRELMVTDGEKLVGTLRYEDLVRIPSEQQEKTPVSKIMHSRLLVTYPDASLYSTIKEMIRHKKNLLPVVESKQSMKFIGVISKEDIIRAHDRIVHFLLEEELSLS